MEKSLHIRLAQTTVVLKIITCKQLQTYSNKSLPRLPQTLNSDLLAWQSLTLIHLHHMSGTNKEEPVTNLQF